MTILEYLKQNQEQILSDLEQLVKHDSPSLHKNLVDQCTQFLKKLFAYRLGVGPTAEYVNDDVGNHLRFDLGEGEERVLILAHYDTVWAQGVLGFRIEGSKAYGPGILDMKGGIVQAIWALKALIELQLMPNKRIIFLLTSDEEQLSPTSRELIEKTAKECQVTFVVEPPVAKTGALKTARKGAGQYKIRVQGISSHAGNDPNIQASAIHELAQQIRYVESLADLEQGTSVNVGVIKGGTMANVVADYAEAEIDVRFFTAAEADRIVHGFSNLEPYFTQTQVQVEGGINRPPMERTASSAKLFQLAQKCAQELGFTLTEAAVGGVSDGNLTAAIGVPTLDGLGSVGEGPHALHEHVVIEELPKRAALLASILQRV